MKGVYMRSVKEKKLICVLLYLIIFSVYCVLISIACKCLGFDSDKANHLLQAKDIVSGNFFLKDWNLTGVTFLTTDLIYYCIGYLVGGISFRSIYIAAGLMVATALFIGHFCAVIDKEKKINRVILYFLLLGIPNINLVYHFRVHTGAIVVTIVCFIIFYSIITKKLSQNYLVLLGFIMFLGVFGDLLVAIECCMPIIAISLYYSCKYEKEYRKLYYKCIFATIFSVVFAVIADKLYFLVGGANPNSYISKKYFTKVSVWPDKIRNLLRDTILMSGSDFTDNAIINISTTIRICNFVFLIIAFIIFVVQIYKFIKNKTADLLSVLMVFSVIFTMAAYVFTDLSEPRYISIIPFFMFVILIRNIDLVFDFFDNKKLISFILICLTSVSTIFSCFDYVNRNYKRYYNTQNVSEELDSSLEIVQFLKDHDLKCGYASFWNASFFTVLSKEDVAIRHITYSDDMFIMRNWFCKNSWYQEEAHFILINTNGEGDSLFCNNAGSSIYFFGDPVERYDFNGYLILVYDYDLSLALGKERNPLVDSVVSVSEFYCSDSELCDNNVVVHPSGFVYGPYASIDQGSYLITYEGENLSESYVDVHSNISEDFYYEVVSKSDNSVAINLTTYSSIDDIEFRLFNYSSEDIVLNRICVD